MADNDLAIVGIEAASRDDAHDIVDDIDALVDQGTITVREIAMAYKTKHGRIKVNHISDHGAKVGAMVGAGWGVVSIGAALATGAVTVATAGVLPIVVGATVGIGLDTGVGAAIGKAFNLHHEAGSKMLKAMTDHVQRGNAIVYLVVDPANAVTVSDALAAKHTVHSVVITAEEAAKIAAELS